MPYRSQARGFARSAALGLALVCAAGAAPPDAPSSGANAEAPPAAVGTVFVIAGPNADPQLIAALGAARANLAPQGIVLQTLHVGDERYAARARDLIDSSGALGVFWFDRPNGAELRAVLLSGSGAYERRIPVHSDGEETAREAAWLIVESGAVALTMGQAPAMEEAEVEEISDVEPPPKKREPGPKKKAPQPPTPPVAEVSTPRFAGGVTFGYLGQGIADPVPWQSGLGIGGLLDIGRVARIGLDYGAWVPWRSGAPTVRWRHRVELRAGVRFAAGKTVTLHVLAGPGLEAQQWLATDGRAEGWRMIVSAGIDAALSVRLFGPVSLWLEPGVDVPLNRFAFIECDRASIDCSGAARRVAFQPWLARPRVRAGFAFLFGR